MSLAIKFTFKAANFCEFFPFSDYHFVTREEMKKEIDAGEFIEHAEFSGNMYGTRYAFRSSPLSTGGAGGESDSLGEASCPYIPHYLLV